MPEELFQEAKDTEKSIQGHYVPERISFSLAEITIQDLVALFIFLDELFLFI